MKRFILITMGLISLCSCQDNLILQDISYSSNDEIIHLDKDSLMIYKRQTSQGEIIKNLIRCENDRFFIDLSPEEASDLGISPEAYEIAKTQMEQLNNTNLKK